MKSSQVMSQQRNKAIAFAIPELISGQDGHTPQASVKNSYNAHCTDFSQHLLVNQTEMHILRSQLVSESTVG